MNNALITITESRSGHDKAYDWAERRKLETHPKTGAAQLVEIRETVKEVVIPVYLQTELPLKPNPPLFADRSDDELLGYGVPPEWLGDVRQADEDGLLLLADRLPAEAAEALLELATGGKPRVPQPAAPVADPFDHPDAQRRFRVVTTRARDHLLITAVEPASEFLDDMKGTSISAPR